MKKVLPMLFAAIFFISCGGDNETQTVKGPSYTLEIPAHMSEASGLNEEASLQYQNMIKGLYIIVIDETKAEMEKAITDNELEDLYTNDLDGYYKLVSENMKSALSRDALPPTKDKKINGMDAKIMDVDGTMEGQHIYWKVAFLEGKDRYYQVMAWTSSDKRGEYEKTMQAMIDSFKETDRGVK